MYELANALSLFQSLDDEPSCLMLTYLCTYVPAKHTAMEFSDKMVGLALVDSNRLWESPHTVYGAQAGLHNCLLPIYLLPSHVNCLHWDNENLGTHVLQMCFLVGGNYHTVRDLHVPPVLLPQGKAKSQALCTSLSQIIHVLCRIWWYHSWAKSYQVSTEKSNWTWLTISLQYLWYSCMKEYLYVICCMHQSFELKM